MRGMTVSVSGESTKMIGHGKSRKTGMRLMQWTGQLVLETR